MTYRHSGWICRHLSNEEHSARRTPMHPAVVRAFIGLVVLAVGLGGMGQWEAVAGGMLYWTDLGIGKIQRVNLDGTGLRDLIATDLRIPRSIAVDAAGSKIYWMDSGTRKVK